MGELCIDVYLAAVILKHPLFSHVIFILLNVVSAFKLFIPCLLYTSRGLEPVLFNLNSNRFVTELPNWFIVNCQFNCSIFFHSINQLHPPMFSFLFLLFIENIFISSLSFRSISRWLVPCHRNFISAIYMNRSSFLLPSRFHWLSLQVSLIVKTGTAITV